MTRYFLNFVAHWLLHERREKINLSQLTAAVWLCSTLNVLLFAVFVVSFPYQFEGK